MAIGGDKGRLEVTLSFNYISRKENWRYDSKIDFKSFNSYISKPIAGCLTTKKQTAEHLKEVEGIVY